MWCNVISLCDSAINWIMFLYKNRRTYVVRHCIVSNRIKCFFWFSCTTRPSYLSVVDHLTSFNWTEWKLLAKSVECRVGFSTVVSDETRLYFQLEEKCLIRVTRGHVLLSLHATTAADSLCSLKDASTASHHPTSVSFIKVRYAATERQSRIKTI